jgi:hypothetical protein
MKTLSDRSKKLSGSITTLHSADKGLFYLLDVKLFEKFREIEEYKPTKELLMPPEFGGAFIYFHKNRSYRAYRLRSNPANKIAIRAFLIDIGVEIYRNFAPKTCYQQPIAFQMIPAMAVFCCLKSFPGTELKTDFLEQSIARTFQFEVEEFTRFKNALGDDRCLIVNIVDPDQKDEEDQREEDVTSEVLSDEAESIGSTREYHEDVAPQLSYYPKLTYLASRGEEHVPFMSDRIPIESSLPSPGSKIFIALTEVESPSSIYGSYSKQEDLSHTYESELMQLSAWMNNANVRKKLKKFRVKLQPKVGEMVIAKGRDGHWQRGLITDISGCIFTVSIAKKPQESQH